MIIDIRSKKEYELGHIKNAIWIPSIELYHNPSKYLDKNKTYTLYCNSGHKSHKLVEYLNNLGYQCQDIVGGYTHNLFRK